MRSDAQTHLFLDVEHFVVLRHVHGLRLPQELERDFFDDLDDQNLMARPIPFGGRVPQMKC